MTLDFLLEDIFSMMEKKSEFEKLEKNKVELTPEERKQVMDAGAVWNFHFGRDGKRKKTPAVWKSVDPKTGETKYICNTHRAMQVRPTLKGAIGTYKFIKTTA